MSGEVSQSFWDHLDELRGAILKSLAVTVVFAVVAFIFKDELFAIVLAPKEGGFVTYKWLDMIADFFSHITRHAGFSDGSDVSGEVFTSADGDLSSGLKEGAASVFNVQLINTGLAQQFIIHVKTALCAGVLAASPYILYQLFRFVSPALYSDERKYAVKVTGSGYLLFILGVLVSYFLIFPLTFRFLGTYQVSGEVENMITLESYMATLISMSLAMGLVFEMPVICWLFGKLGFLSDAFMRQYRRHAIVIILIVAAIITPTSDVFTLLAVSLPMWLLYEGSILLVKATGKAKTPTQNIPEE